MFKNKFQKFYECSFINIILSNRYLIFSILLFSIFPIISTQLYFRHDDAQWLLWAHEFNKPLLYVFHPDPQINNFSGYPGLAGYYRPFAGLYIIFIQYIFGNSPFFFHLIAGLFLIGSIIFMFKITKLLSNEIAAFFCVIIFFICFNSIFNSFFHVAYPLLFFLQISGFYFCILGLIRNKLRYVMLSFLFLLPATSKQTTPFILLSIILFYFINNWGTSFPDIKDKFIILCLALSSFAVIPLSHRASRDVGTILNLEPLEIINYIKERLYYYGDILTTGITGISLFLIILLYISFLTLSKIRSSDNRYNKRYLLLSILVSIVSIILTYVLIHSGNISIFILLVFLGLCFRVNNATRLPLIWFFVSFCIFISLKNYIGTYILEAAYGLSIAMGILLYFIVEQMKTVFEVNDFIRENSKRIVFVIIVIITFSGLVLLKTGHIPFLEKFDVTQVLIKTNKNFRDMTNSLQELPPNSVVYEISEESLGLTGKQRLFLSLKERAENIKVMRSGDKQAMVRISGRYDIIFKDVSKGERPWESNRNFPGERNLYFVVNSKLEKNIAEKEYSLKLIRAIKRGETEAAVYIIQ
jgi:hypothetical protein